MPYIPKGYNVFTKTPLFKFLIDELKIELKDVQKIVAKRRVLQNGNYITKPNQIITGDIIVYQFVPSSKGLKPIYTDDDFVVYDKPEFVYTMPQNRQTDYSIVDEARASFGNQANIVHRLDCETSGLLIVALNKKAEIELKQMFYKQQIIKKYTAIVKGKIDQELVLDIPLISNNDFSITKHKTQVSPFGKMAITKIKPLHYNLKLNQTKLTLTPLSGRTHQLRVHLFHLLHKIVGDPLYGTSYEFASRYLDGKIKLKDRIKTLQSPRLLLHASYLEFDYNNKHHKISSPAKIDYYDKNNKTIK